MTEDAFAVARERMVAAIAAEIHPSPDVLRALQTVRREEFVPTFFSIPPGGVEESVERRAADATPDVVALIYDMARALGIDRDAEGRTTSTVSAPQLLARMLDVLDLERGMRVLEIGAGSGYTAALLAEMVGDPALVTTIDIDEALVNVARDRLTRLDYAGICVVAGDGHDGVPGRAPFDRVVATVGCLDLSPAWFAQLAPGGVVVVPLVHGGLHPVVKVAVHDGLITGRVVSRAGFVGIQGYQASTIAPWTMTARPPREAPVESRRIQLPDHLDRVGLWDFAYYLALVNPRTGQGPTLADVDGSAATIGQELTWVGPGGAALGDQLVGHLEAWIELGQPPADAYTSTWLARGEGRAGDRRWVIGRIDHDQVVAL